LLLNIEETGPPPELIIDIVTISTQYILFALQILYDHYRESKKKKGKVIIQINGEFDSG
jgi:hypothetical protein